MRSAPQPKYYSGPSNRSGGIQAAAQEALAGHETPLLVGLPVLFQRSQSTSKVALHVQLSLAPLSSMKLPPGRGCKQHAAGAALGRHTLCLRLFVDLSGVSTSQNSVRTAS